MDTIEKALFGFMVVVSILFLVLAGCMVASTIVEIDCKTHPGKCQTANETHHVELKSD